MKYFSVNCNHFSSFVSIETDESNIVNDVNNVIDYVIENNIMTEDEAYSAYIEEISEDEYNRAPKN